MQIDVDRDPIKVNKLLGKRASIGPIPASQIIPWALIGGMTYFVLVMLLALGIEIWLACWVWLAASWWVLTGERTYALIKSWAPLPGVDWINGETLFIRATEPGVWKRKQRERIKPIRVETQTGARGFMPFQKFSHIHSIAEIAIGGHTFACLVLHNPDTDQWSAQIPFTFEGFHPQLFRHEVEAAVRALYRSMSELGQGEFLTFHLSCRSDIRRRAQHLRQQAKSAPLPQLSILLMNEEQHIKELTERGVRQEWEQIVWATWTAEKNLQEKNDVIGKTLLSLQKLYQGWSRSLTGTEQQHFNTFYVDLARQIHEHGYLAWRNLLETKADLSVQALSSQAVWEWLWYRFNQRSAPKLPQCIQIIEAEAGLQQHVPISGQKDLTTLLIQGEHGQTTCPKHKQQHGYVYANGRVGKVMVIEAPPELWRNSREQLMWIWNRLSASYVRDTEAVIQITPKERWSTQDELEKMSRQSYTAEKRALMEGTGKLVHANLQGEYAADALRKLLEGRHPLYCAPVFMVWRETEQQADEAVAQLCNAFGAAQAVAEDDIAWRVWVETLPINDFPLLQKFSVFSDRRLTLDSETVAGFLPLVRPRSLDGKGVEFLTERGGQPVYIDLFGYHPGRVLITGASGSGKSAMAGRVLAEALAQQIPVMGIDLSSGGNSTFQMLVTMLGDEKAAYVDILREQLNLLEPPDVRNLPTELQVQRIKRWKDLARQAIVAIAMGQLDDPQLLDRVESICLRLLEVFFSDAEMIERYNEAFEQGWKSEQWRRIPTLHELLTFCSREKLGLETYEEIDARAINQIVNQVGAKLVDPNIGDAIGRPSTVSPDPLIKFYALSGLSNESNAYIMAISAQMACLRNALAHPRSLFVGDELSVLLGKEGFADLVGELLATGRKEGVSTLILSQDLDAIVDCSASSKILANITTNITGLTTHAATAAYINTLGYDPAIIAQNATERFRGNRGELYTCWLIERNNRFWQTRYYSAPMTLAALANAEPEKAARQRILAHYPKTTRGYMEGLAHFSKEYVKALRGGQRLEDIGVSRHAPQTQRSRPLTPLRPIPPAYARQHP